MTDTVQPTDSSAKKILVVEDNEVLSGIYVRRLQMEGFDTQLVTNGQEAVTTAEKFQPDLILLDLMLPGMNGMDILDQIRANDATKDAKVFVFSALEDGSLLRAHEQQRDRIMQAGADEYLVKSRDLFNEVIDKIKTTLGA